MGGFNPAWFWAVGIAAVLTLISATQIAEGKRAILRVIAVAGFLLGGIGLVVDFHSAYELRLPFSSRAESLSLSTPLDDQWHLLTDDQRATISSEMGTGNAYRIHIQTCQFRDCIELGKSFYEFFDGLHWNPEKPIPNINLDPGIRVGSGVGLKEKSGSDLLLKALREGGFPAVYHAIGTNQNDTTIFLEIGMKPH